MQQQKYDPEIERKRLIKLVHVARRDLGMEEGDYRAILKSVSGGKDSSAAMTITELEKVISHLKRCGFKVRTKGKNKPAKAKPSRPLATDPESKKIRALWLFLHELGVVKNPSEAALAGYVKRITRVDALQWINGEQANTLIEALKKWAMRFLPKAVEELTQQVKSLPLTDIQAAQLNSGLSIALSRGTFDPMQAIWQDLTAVLAKAGG